MVDWDFNLLESLIEDRGDDVIHEQAISCPSCRLEDTYASNIYNEGQPATAVNGSPGCRKCGGTGWVFRNACVIHGLLTTFKTGNNPTLSQGGFLDPGECMFSPSLRARPVTDWDKITVPYPAPIGDGQTILRGAGSRDINSTLDTGLDPDTDRLWYTPSCIIWCEDQNGVVYAPEIDFELVQGDNKLVRWIGNRPAKNTVYTIKYQGYFEFVVFSTPLIRFDNARSLAPAVQLRKFHVVFPNAYRLDSPAKREEDQVLFTTKTTV